MTVVREARPGDWEAVASLLEELGRPKTRPEERAEHREAFARYLARSTTVALLAEEDGEIVGFLDLEFRQRLNLLVPQAWIPDLVVASRARRRGVGHALLSRAEEFARERDVSG